jgi:hypothetical protein
MEIIVIRELWARGIMPSCTSIGRGSKYYGNFVKGGKNNVVRPMNMYLSEAIAYKKMY